MLHEPEWAADLLKKRSQMAVDENGELVPLALLQPTRKAAGSAGSADAVESDPEAFDGRSGMLHKDYKLWRACENGELHVVRESLKIGANPNAQHPTVFKWTAVHLAAMNDQAPTLELLHEYGAQLDLRDASGRTPIRLARKHLRLSAVRALEAMMGYGEGEGSDTDIELGEDFPCNLQEEFGINSSLPDDLPQDYQHSFFKDLQDKLARNESTIGASEFKAQQANKEASEKRRVAACEYPEPEKQDAEGFTESQRMHLNRLVHASKVNLETGIPIEQVLGDEQYAPPPGGYDLPARKKTNEEGPDNKEHPQGRPTGDGYYERPPLVNHPLDDLQEQSE